jgi:hypothetical protein
MDDRQAPLVAARVAVLAETLHVPAGSLFDSIP